VGGERLKLDKKIKELPWPEELAEDAECGFKVRGTWITANHERLLVLTVQQKRLSWVKQDDQKDFRAVISKKQSEFAIIVKGETGQKHKKISQMTYRQSLYWGNAQIDKKTKDMIKCIVGNEGDKNPVGAIDAWMQEIIEKRLEETRAVAGAFADDDHELCPDELPAGLTDWIQRDVLTNDKTIIYKKGGVRGTCAACGNTFHTAYKMLQYQHMDCPICGEENSLLVLENSAAWKADFVANVIAIQKGRDGTVWFRQWHVIRDNAARYENGAEKHLKEIARYGIRGNKTGMWKKEGKSGFCGANQRYDCGGWEREKTVNTYESNYGYEFYTGGLAEAAEGTPLQYAALAQYNAQAGIRKDIVKYAADFVRYPVLEYLFKAGYHRIVSQKVVCTIEKSLKNVILWQRKDLKECFRFPLRLLKCIPPEEWNMEDVGLMTALYRHENNGKKLTDKEILTLFKLKIEPELIDSTTKYGGAVKTVNYLAKQDALCDGEHTGGITRIYRDYIRECEQLEFDMTKSEIIFPKDLRAAHERTSRMIVHKKSAAIQEKFDKATAKLKKWTWKNGGLLIRPANSQEELIEEGAALNHCVGGYAESMANGITAIFVIRKAEEPFTPFYTLELKDKRVVQCRTTHNAPYDGGIKDFVDCWLEKVVNKGARKKDKSKVGA
jgi:hypothetical protein